MLLLSVSEAKVCSVDMDEMSLAEEDWEADPDTTSDTWHTVEQTRWYKVQSLNDKLQSFLPAYWAEHLTIKTEALTSLILQLNTQCYHILV